MQMETERCHMAKAAAPILDFTTVAEYVCDVCPELMEADSRARMNRPHARCKLKMVDNCAELRRPV
jgi:hypothetical protein